MVEPLEDPDEARRSTQLAGVSDMDLVRELVSRASSSANGIIIGMAHPREDHGRTSLLIDVAVAGNSPETLKVLLRRIHTEVANRLTDLG